MLDYSSLKSSILALERSLFRVAANAGLISDVDAWMATHQARNETSHTYNRQTALAVFAMAPLFLEQAKRFLAELYLRND